MKYLLVISTVMALLLVSCNENPVKQRENTGDTIAPGIGTTDTIAIPKDSASISLTAILDSLHKISFVAESNRYIDSFSQHQHGIAFLIDTVSDKEINFRAGYNGDQRFETYHYFKVNPQNFDIKVMEPVSGDELTIEEYQKVQQ